MTYVSHMIEHILLAQLLPIPLVLAAGSRLRWRMPMPLAWAIGVAAMVGTSMPPAYRLAEASLPLNWAMRATLILAGFVFWLAVLGHGQAMRPGPGAMVTYLVSACFATTLAGVYIAFSATTTDQQVAGLIMWVPCCVVYLSASVAVVVRGLRPGTLN